MEPHCWWCKGGQNKREGSEKRVPYLPILPFNGRPLLAVGSVKIGGVGWGWCSCLVHFSHPPSSLQRGQEGVGSQAYRVTTLTLKRESLRSPRAAAAQDNRTSMLRDSAGSSLPLENHLWAWR